MHFEDYTILSIAASKTKGKSTVLAHHESKSLMFIIHSCVRTVVRDSWLSKISLFFKGFLYYYHLIALCKLTLFTTNFIQ